MFKDNYLRTSDRDFRESAEHENELARKQVANIIKLKAVRRERLWNWNSEKGIF
jgi:hypothetical protein